MTSGPFLDQISNAPLQARTRRVCRLASQLRHKQGKHSQRAARAPDSGEKGGNDTAQSRNPAASRLGPTEEQFAPTAPQPTHHDLKSSAVCAAHHLYETADSEEAPSMSQRATRHSKSHEPSNAPLMMRIAQLNLSYELRTQVLSWLSRGDPQ